MKAIKLGVLILLLVATGVGDAMASRGGHRGGARVHFGFAFGPWWGPWYYPPYYSPLVVERGPTVYIEQSSADTASGARPPSNVWYYCESSGGYYPYTRECPEGWQEVSPQPPGVR